MTIRDKFGKLERKISITADPGLSVSYLFAIRVRIVAEWFFKLLQTLVYRRKALRGTRLARRMHAGQEALVIGNGPSAAKLHCGKVRKWQKDGLQTIVINSFSSHGRRALQHLKLLCPKVSLLI